MEPSATLPNEADGSADAAPAGPVWLKGFAQLPRNRQIAALGGIALAIAMIVAAVLWSQAPDYAVLFGNLPDKEMGEVLEAIEKLNIPHQVDIKTGSLKVPADRVHEIRLKLASQGLPKDSTPGFELLDQDQGFGTSHMMETARFQRALEGEIARSITTLQAVKAARVHLALPKETVFLREKKKPSASVVVHLHPGKELAESQVEAIVHLVAASVPQLEPAAVTVVDHSGRLISSKDRGNDRMAELTLTNRQFEYKKEVEQHLMERVSNILTPVVGSEGLSTQVSADIDFNVTERTQETYNPESPAVRSEQTTEEQNRNAGPGGVPGALTNQPPAAGVAPELATGAQPAGQSGGGTPPGQNSSSRSATRNYELDRTVSHTRVGLGMVRRITAAVVVDHHKVLQDDGSLVVKPYSDEELARFTELVKEAVGFDATRGDHVTVANAAFREEGATEAPLKWWEQPWFWPLVRQVTAALLVLLIVFGFLRPMLRLLIRGPEPTAEELRALEVLSGGPTAGEAVAGEGAVPGLEGELAEDQLTLGIEDELSVLEGPASDYQRRLRFAQKMVDEDPKRVAQLLKTWLAEENFVI